MYTHFFKYEHEKVMWEELKRRKKVSNPEIWSRKLNELCKSKRRGFNEFVITMKMNYITNDWEEHLSNIGQMGR